MKLVRLTIKAKYEYKTPRRWLLLTYLKIRQDSDAPVLQLGVHRWVATSKSMQT